MAIRQKKKSTILIIERARTANCLLIAQLCGLPPKAAFASSANQRQQMQILATEPQLSALPFFLKKPTLCSLCHFIFPVPVPSVVKNISLMKLEASE